MIDSKLIDKITLLYNKLIINPALSHVYSMEIDRLIRQKYGVKYGATLSKNDVHSTGPLPNYLFEGLIKSPIKTEEKKRTTNYILEAEKLYKDFDYNTAFSWLQRNIAGVELNAINLFIANNRVTKENVRLYFINKYLQFYQQELELLDSSASKFFFKLASKNINEATNGPLVTVLMPVYNASITLGIALESILNQSWKNLQIILIDDSSTDDSFQKMKEFEKSDKRIELLRMKDNLGPYACRNYGALHARGKYITIHDSDDFAFPNRIQLQVDAIESTDADCSLGYMLRMNEYGLVTRAAPIGAMSLDGYLRKCFVSLMVKTNIFRKKLGAWDYVRVGADAELLDRISALKLKNVIIEKPLIIALDHNDSLTNSKNFGLLNDLRNQYVSSYQKWHKNSDIKPLNILSNSRIFSAPNEILVNHDLLDRCLKTRRKDIEIISSSELFDDGWYQKKYNKLLIDEGLSSVEHYIVYGREMLLDPSPIFSSRFYLNTRSTKQNPLLHHLKGRDPGPSIKNILFAANLVFQDVDSTAGIKFAEENLPNEYKYAINILKANNALKSNNYIEWLKYLNLYLSKFSTASIKLDSRNNMLFEQLTASDVSKKRNNGPLVSIIMAAWNSEKTLRSAANSILNQTWGNLELIIVDDFSSDNTWEIMKEIKNNDSRVKISRNFKNVGPYVSKNIALTYSSGEWITGHDADDWAHPQRIESHINKIFEDNQCEVSVGYMLRMQPNGYFDQITPLNGFTLDGVARIASISAMFKRSFLVEKLGFWDSVRFGADSEMISRSQKILGEKFKVYSLIGMICLNWEGSLTNDPLHGIRTSSGLSGVRSNYKEAWVSKHKSASDSELFVDFPPSKGVYHDDPVHVVSLQDIKLALGYLNGE